jgi:glycosyltransferase involved in cell wall biosynthesis
MVFFTIVIPVYNRASIVGQTIDSVLEQTHFSFELIIVDDGSTDTIAEVIRPYLKDNRVQYHKIVNSERGAARNFGVNQSKGDYVTFLDSDDILFPWHFRIAAEKILEANSPKLFHLAYEVHHLDGKVISPPLLPSPVNDKLIEGNFMSCLGVFLRRDIALENLFDEDRRLSGSEDYELWMRLASRVPILAYPDITSKLIQHADRSVMDTDIKKLSTRIYLLEDKLQHDKFFMQRFNNRWLEFRAYNALYLALHVAIAGQRLLALRKLLFVVKQNAKVMITYRFAVVLKKIILW